MAERTGMEKRQIPCSRSRCADSGEAAAVKTYDSKQFAAMIHASPKWVCE
ncbi:hypothetical protein LCGC14_2469930, partial [marine sediment metagenome]